MSSSLQTTDVVSQFISTIPVSTATQEAISFFIGTFAELALLFVGISFIVSLINHYLPAEKIQAILSGSRGYGAAIALGAVTPFCSCSTLPMTVGLLKARASFGPVMAFLFTSPLVNPFIIALFWVTFGAQITLLYSIFAITMSGVCGAVLAHFNFERFIKHESLGISNQCNDSNAAKTSCEPQSCTPSSTVSNISTDSCCSPTDTANAETSNCCETEPKYQSNHTFYSLVKGAFNELKTMLPYMVIGVAIGAVLHGYVPAQLFTSFANTSLMLLIPMSAIIGVFLYVRASTMVPIAASLIAKGMSVGAVMSLTIAGAGASLPEMVMLKRLFHWPLLLAFITSVFLTACFTGFVIELLNVGVTL
ncbi:permease [Thalassotalea ganghwensis]